MQQFYGDDTDRTGLADKHSTLMALYLLSAMKGADLALLPASFRALENDLMMTPKDLAILALCQGVAIAISGPFWGNLTDSGVSRKLMLKIGVLAWGLCTFQLAFTSSFWMMASLRALNGFALSIVLPVTQSYLADLVDEDSLGMVCGKAYLASNFGQVCATLTVLPVSEQIFFGSYMGWRIALAAVGIMSLCLAIFVQLGIPEDNRTFYSDRLGIRREFAKLHKFMKIGTFRVILLQGVFGTIPGSAQSFMIMYFQYIGISNPMCALLLALRTVGEGLGGALGGMLGDIANERSAKFGRTVVAMASLLNGLPMIYMVFMGFPRDASIALSLAGVLFGFGILTSWEVPGCLQPTMLRIIPRRHVSSAIAWDVAVVFTAGNTIGPILVGYIAQEVFQYHPTDQSLQDMSEDVRTGNANALGHALFFSSAIPATLSCLIFTIMWKTIPEDLRLKEEREAEDSESTNETTWLLQKGSSAAEAHDLQAQS
eukprot:TRINITY_DN23708_c0_g1_i1.p1 TRINITY_DN23708_c0_g1~~TRINITY_DN23708_c0_g1_i1.p1  ORF type:complete len:486 (-),score=85.34 TRINITY_DN23708_c0_g1_i1:54-1511(-)